MVETNSGRKKIRKAVIPAAGYGTRFLPATKTIPKEMLPVLDKPTIQYTVEELIDAGIEEIIFVVSNNKHALEDHFDRLPELEDRLEKNGKTKELESIRNLPNAAEYFFVRQKEINGNGGAILTAKNLVGDEPFIVFWADDIVRAEPSRAKQLIAAYEKFGGSILACETRNQPEDMNKYGFSAGEEIEPGVLKTTSIIEKPGPGNAPSDFAAFSFVFDPKIFPALEEAQKTITDRELVYVDGLNIMCQNGDPIYSVKIKNGVIYDCGNVSDYLKTNISLGLEREDLKDDLQKFINEKADR